MLKAKIYLLALINTLVAAAAVGATATKLQNSAPLTGVVDKSLPRQVIIISFPGGPSLVPSNRQGLTTIFAQILEEGPSSLGSDEFRKKLFLNNASLEFTPMRMGFNIIIKASPATLDEAVGLAQQTLSRPKLNEETFARAKKKVLGQTASSFESMRAVLLYYGVRDAMGFQPLSFDGSGSPKSLANITLKDLQDLKASMFDIKHAFYTSAGPAAIDAVAGALNKSFLKGTESSYVPREIPKFDAARVARKDLKITVIDKAKATDNQVLFVYPEFVKMDTPELVVGEVAHEILGGGLTGRLGKTLRVERGLTYHAGSMIGSYGWGVYTFGGNEQLPKLLSGVPEVIASFKKEGLRKEEIDQAKESKLQLYRTDMELPQDKVVERIGLLFKGLDPNFYDHYEGNLKAVTPQKVKSFVEQKILAKGGYLYLVGDKAEVLKALKIAGFDTAKVEMKSVSEIE